MDLVKAIKLAVKFCSKDMGAPVTARCVRFIPRKDGHDRSSLVVHNGGFGLRILFDQDVPNCLLDATPLAAMAKEAKTNMTITEMEDIGYGTVVFTLIGGKAGEVKYKVGGESPSKWVGLDEAIPDIFAPIPEWWVAQKVIHAASKDVDHMLSMVNFTDDYVEATDQVRVARAEVRIPLKGILPASMFSHWNNTPDVEVASTETTAYFKIGDEVRSHRFMSTRFPEYPDCSKLIPEVHEGPEAVAPISGLKDVIKRAVTASPTNLVSLEFNMGCLNVRSYQDGVPSMFESELDVPCNGTGELLIDGKLVLESLNQMDTPNVRLCYGEPLHPLRLESGHYQECIWPWQT